MLNNKQPQSSGLQKFILRYPLYVRIVFGLLVLFGMVGNLTGKREGSIIVFIFVALCWCLSRIIDEAFVSLRTLRRLNAREAGVKKTRDEDEDDPGSNDPPMPPSYV